MKLILYSPGIWVIHIWRTYSQYDRNAKQTNDNLWKDIRSAGRPHWHFCNSHASTYLFLGVISEILIVLQWMNSHIFGGVLPFRDWQQHAERLFGEACWATVLGQHISTASHNLERLLDQSSGQHRSAACSSSTSWATTTMARRTMVRL